MTLLAALLALVPSTQALAGQDPVPDPQLLEPQQDPLVVDPAVAPPRPPVLVSGIRAELDADGPAVKVTQTIELWNPADIEQGFELLLPLGTDAAIHGIALHEGADAIEGRLFDVAEARALRRRLAEERADAALLEHWGQALYRAEVDGIAPGELRVVTLTYTDLVRRENELSLLRLPLTAFRRVAAPVTLEVVGRIATDEPVRTLYSPTLDVRETNGWESGGDRVRFHSEFGAPAAPFPCDADFLLYYRSGPPGDLLDVSVLSERPDPSEPGYFLAVLNGIPDETLVPEPKNVVFVLDLSGSMNQDGKIGQAKAALRFLAEKLRPEDRFNLVDYASDAALFRDVLQVPNAATLDELVTHVDGVAADGGTNIEAALTLAMTQFTDDSLLNQIVFLTDGVPTEGEADPSLLAARVREANTHDARIVAFGLGFDVNGALLDRLALESRGLSEYVLPSEEIEDKVPGFYARMQMPLVLDAELELTGAEAIDVFPRETGDLYGGHQLLLVGRYAEPGNSTLEIRGRRGHDAVEMSFPLPLVESSDPSETGFVARLWATKKIGYLVDDIRLSGETEERIAEIVRLGTRFGILTEYTAFLTANDVDLFAFDDNVLACTNEIRDRATVTSGAHGVAQACNSKDLQRGNQLGLANSWLDENGNRVSVGGVRCVAGKAFFRRDDAWCDSTLVPDEAEREVMLFSDEFFTLLDRHPWLGGCTDRVGEVVVRLAGENVRIKAQG